MANSVCSQALSFGADYVPMADVENLPRRALVANAQKNGAV